MTGDAWPLQTYLELGPLPTAVPCARLHARYVMEEWGLTILAETTELLVSELVTNAVRAAATRDYPAPVRLRLSSDKSRVLVEVWDADPRPPAPEDPTASSFPDLDSETGRGLFLVAALSHRWSWHPSRDQSGKVIWCEIA
jgi:anti-sigma regulatory factor (Ser/Thr protein kinase)